jgi:Rrf2 family protein
MSDASSLALHAMAHLAKHQGEIVSTHQIASDFDVSENHLAKVCQRLSKAGLVEAIRGPHGGFRLSRPADQILLLEIYETIDGRLNPDGCLSGKPACSSGKCVLGGLLQSINRQVFQYFSQTSLADLAEEKGQGTRGPDFESAPTEAM